MKFQFAQSQGSEPTLTAVFVDYDNIYLSLRKKSDEAAKRFSKDAHLWIKEIESGRLITPSGISAAPASRRIVMNRCYGNPVPRRNQHDNSTDMNSFPFVRHHYLRAGFEVVDCPPLTAQLKNSADIRMVMDVRDNLDHETRFDEFILLSSDADFTPLLHRLRAHARRTVVYSNDNTAAPYRAISDGEVREQSLLQFLLEGRIGDEANAAEAIVAVEAAPASRVEDFENLRAEIVAEVIATVRSAGQPLPLEVLADRAVRALGHDRTVATSWAGMGGFRELLLKALPADVRLTDQPPFFVVDLSRALPAQKPEQRPAEIRAEPRREIAYEPNREPRIERAIERSNGHAAPPQAFVAPQPALQGQMAQRPAAPMPSQQPIGQTTFASLPVAPPVARAPVVPGHSQQAAVEQKPVARSQANINATIQQSIARIHDACQAPPLAPPEYRALFEAMADEITANNLSGSQTFVNIEMRAAERGVVLRRDDIRFVLDVVSEPDPWFEQGASANLFSSRFRNFVVARCRSQGLSLSSDELDLIEAWFGGSPAVTSPAAAAPGQAPVQQQQMAQPARQQLASQPQGQLPGQWWSLDEGREHVAAGRSQDDEFPRIIRSRLKG